MCPGEEEKVTKSQKISRSGSQNFQWVQQSPGVSVKHWWELSKEKFYTGVWVALKGTQHFYIYLFLEIEFIDQCYGVVSANYSLISKKLSVLV